MVSQVPKLSPASLNHGDCFVLDCGLSVFLWTGRDANKYEKTKAAGFLQALTNERGGLGKVEVGYVLDEPSSESESSCVDEPDADDVRFFSVLMGRGGVDASGEPASDEAEEEAKTFLSSEDLLNAKLAILPAETGGCDEMHGREKRGDIVLFQYMDDGEILPVEDDGGEVLKVGVLGGWFFG